MRKEPDPGADGAVRSPPRSRVSFILYLFAHFFIWGSLAFGGGWSIIAQIRVELIEKKHFFTEEDLSDMISLAKSFPGLMITNAAYGVGFHLAGVLGGVVCTAAAVLPAFICIVLVALLYTSLRENALLNSAMLGVRAAVIPVIASSAARLGKASIKSPTHWGIMIIVFIAGFGFSINNVLLVIFGAAAGFVFTVRDRHD